MDIPRFLDLALALETEISKLYDLIADHSGDPLTAASLKAIAAEELNHANIIRRGKRYYEEYPDLFSGIIMNEDEASAGVEEVRAFRAALERKKEPLIDSLRRLLDFEKRFERVHLGASVKIADPTLKHLFTGLSKGDQAHVTILTKLLESSG
jgi:rubrerythrin